MDTATFDAILSDIAAGEAAHRALTDHGIPRKQFYALLAKDDDAGNRYARAKQAGLEVLADEIIEIADDGRNDLWMDEDGKRIEANDVIARSRLRVDSRKWLLSKLAPKKYGDRLDTTHSGPDGGPVELAIRWASEKS